MWEPWKMKVSKRRCWTLLLLLATLAGLVWFVAVLTEQARGPGTAGMKKACGIGSRAGHFNQPNILLNGRSDVAMVTPWLAPIVWETTFDPVLLDATYEPCGITVAVSVFAVGRYTQFLRNFLETAERHFFVNFQVHYYVFTDRPDEVPSVELAKGRKLFVRSVPASQRWQEITSSRMPRLLQLITEISNTADYIFSLDVDSQFHGRWGTETLGELVAAVHPWFYKTERTQYPYERRSTSTAYMAPEAGDFYYAGAVFGGQLAAVRDLVETCHHNFELDGLRGIEAAWQEESHLNHYLNIHRPSKVLSPEYQWHDIKQREPEIRIIRFSGVDKNYADIRPNV